MGYETDPDGGVAILDPARHKPEKQEGEPKFEADDVSREAIESRLSDRLAALQTAGAAIEDDKPGTVEVSDETALEAKPDDAATPDADASEEKKEAVADPNAPTLPAAIRRSLKAYEWTDEEIDQNLKVLGPSFITAAQKLHNTRNQETARWAEIGRAQRQPVAAPDAITTAPDAAKSQPIPKLDAVALKEHYGDDALIDKILGPVNAAIDRLNEEVLPAVRHTQQVAQQSEQRALFNAIEGFFGTPEMKSYAELYGKVGDPSFAQTHVDSRNKVLDLAGALLVGAAKEGRNLNLDEALTLAHDSVSGDYKSKAAKQELKASLQTRERGISLKPGNKAAAPKGKSNDRSDIEMRVGKRLADVFKSA